MCLAEPYSPAWPPENTEACKEAVEVVVRDVSVVLPDEAIAKS